MSNELSLAERMRLANLAEKRSGLVDELKEIVPTMSQAFVRYMEKKLIEREGENKASFSYREYRDYFERFVKCITQIREIDKRDNIEVMEKASTLEDSFSVRLDGIIKRQSERKWQALVESIEDGFIKLTYDLCGVIVEPTPKKRHYLPKRYQREGDAPRSFWDFIKQNTYKIYQVLTLLGLFLVGQFFINILYEFTPIYQNWALLYLMPLASVLLGIVLEFDILKEETGITKGWIIAFVFGGIYALLPLLAPIFISGYIFYSMAKKRALPKSHLIFMTIYGYITSIMLECGLIFVETQKIMFPINLGWGNIPVWITGICLVLSCATVYFEGWIIISYFESERLKGGLGWIFGILMCIAEITCPLVGGYLFMIIERLIDVTFNLRARKNQEGEVEEE